MAKVTLKIYGNEYTIAGDKTEDEIRKICYHVDEIMREMGKNATDTTTSGLAVLTAVNLSEDCFDLERQLERLTEENEKLEADVEYYMNMLEQFKKSDRQKKDDAGEVRDKLNESQQQVKELNAKCADYENNFFDIQMENIRLKNELEKIKNK